MDVFKCWPADNDPKVIDRAEFEAATLKKHPWYQENDQGEEVQFAICPACNNPIQIIGLYRLPARVQQPFGRHTAHGIRGLAPLNAEDRDNCPYFRPRPHQKTARRNQMSEVSRRILQILIEQFDRVMYILRKQTGIYFSRNKARQMLEKYRAERGYLYTGANLQNIPWIFAYMADSQALFGQHLKNADLINAIQENVPGALVTSEGKLLSEKNTFLSLDVCFIDHRVAPKADTGGITESMRMIVSTTEGHTARTILEQEIVFEPGYFQALIQSTNDESRRDLALVDMARQVLGDLR